MHFPKFIFKALFIGAVLFFPTSALADKVGPLQKMPTQTQKDVKTSDQKTKHNPLIKSVNKSQPIHLKNVKPSEYVKRAVKKKTLSKTANQIANKARITSKNLKDQSRKIPPKKKDISEKKIDYFKKESKTFVKKPVKQKENVYSKPKAEKDPLEESKHQIASKEKTELPQRELFSVNKKEKGLKKKKTAMKTNVLTNTKPKPVRAPVPTKKHFNDLQIILTVLENHSDGASKSRTNLSHNTISFFDKWCIWENYSKFDLEQVYVFDTYKLCNQWTNAPPSQPPQRFLFS